MNDIPGLNLLPPKWQGIVIALVGLFGVIVPQVGRLCKAIMAGGGVRGILSGLWLGTNTDHKAIAALVDTKIAQSQTEFLAKNPTAK